jgi:hypothetical protein
VAQHADSHSARATVQVGVTCPLFAAIFAGGTYSPLLHTMVDDILELGTDGAFELPTTPTAASVKQQQKVRVPPPAVQQQQQQPQPQLRYQVLKAASPNGVTLEVRVHAPDGSKAEQAQAAVSSNSRLVVRWKSGEALLLQLPQVEPSSLSAWTVAGGVLVLRVKVR